MSRKISLPASAHECAASATIDADPVMTATTDFARAMSALATNATITVRRLSPCWPCSSFAVSAMLRSLPLGGHPLKRRSRGTRRIPGEGVCRSLPPRATRAPSAAPSKAARSLGRVADDVEAGPRVAGIPPSGGLVLDGHLAAGAGHDDARREPLELAGSVVVHDREAVVLDEQRLPAAVDDRVE